MILEELRAASDTLNAALNQYLGLCNSISQHYCRGIGDAPEEAASLIIKELLLIASYKTKFQRANAALSVARNSIRTTVSINTLPAEVLSHIFYLVVYGQPCKFHYTYEYPTYPTRLTHVCSRWRQLAINSPTLWSHIDVSSHGFRDSDEQHQRHLAHARAWLARAGDTQLDVHVAENFPYGLYLGDPTLLKLLISLNDRMRSLEIYVKLDDRHHRGADLVGSNFYMQTLATCLVNCTPGVLKHLTLVVRESGDTLFLQARGASNRITDYGYGTSLPALNLNISEPELENLLLSITRLKLNVSYFPWSSRAYHGLTELRLYRNNSSVRIPDVQFTAILAASPHLDTLEFGIKIHPSSPPPLPVPLNSLRTLIVDTDRLGNLLPLLAPGTQPITVSLFIPQQSILGAPTSIGVRKYPEIRLFSQWNVTGFCARNVCFLRDICQLVDLMPGAKTLALTTPLDSQENLDAQLRGLDSQVSLDTLCLLTGRKVSIDYRNLVVMVRRYRVKKLALGSEYSITNAGDPVFVTGSRTKLRDELMSLGVAAEFYSPSDRHWVDYFGHDFESYAQSHVQ